MTFQIWIIMALSFWLIAAGCKFYEDRKYYKKEFELAHEHINSIQQRFNEDKEYILEIELELNQSNKVIESLITQFEDYVEYEGYRTPKKYNSYDEVDDWIVKVTTKEFIEQMSWKSSLEKKASRSIVSLNLQEQINNISEVTKNNLSVIESRFTKQGLEDIYSLISSKT